MKRGRPRKRHFDKEGHVSEDLSDKEWSVSHWYDRTVMSNRGLMKIAVCVLMRIDDWHRVHAWVEAGSGQEIKDLAIREAKKKLL